MAKKGQRFWLQIFQASWLGSKFQTGVRTAIAGSAEWTILAYPICTAALFQIYCLQFHDSWLQEARAFLLTQNSNLDCCFKSSQPCQYQQSFKTTPFLILLPPSKIPPIWGLKNCFHFLVLEGKGEREKESRNRGSQTERDFASLGHFPNAHNS